MMGALQWPASAATLLGSWLIASTCKCCCRQSASPAIGGHSGAGTTANSTMHRRRSGKALSRRQRHWASASLSSAARRSTARSVLWLTTRWRASSKPNAPISASATATRPIQRPWGRSTLGNGAFMSLNGLPRSVQQMRRPWRRVRAVNAWVHILTAGCVSRVRLSVRWKTGPPAAAVPCVSAPIPIDPWSEPLRLDRQGLSDGYPGRRPPRSTRPPCTSATTTWPDPGPTKLHFCATLRPRPTTQSKPSPGCATPPLIGRAEPPCSMACFSWPFSFGQGQLVAASRTGVAMPQPATQLDTGDADGQPGRARCEAGRNIAGVMHTQDDPAHADVEGQ